MTSKPKYAGWGLALGGVLGAAFGLLAGHVGLWLAIGVAIGLMLGAGLRRKGWWRRRNPGNRLGSAACDNLGVSGKDAPGERFVRWPQRRAIRTGAAQVLRRRKPSPRDDKREGSTVWHC